MIKTLFCILLLSTTLAFAKDQSWKEVFKKDGITIYGGKKVAGLIPFKAVGQINHPIKDLVGLLNDYKSKHEWAPKLKKVTMHKQLGADHYIFSEYYKTPWPAYDREFLLEGKLIQQGNQYIFDAKSTQDMSFADSSYVQADVRKLTLILTAVDSTKTHISFEFFGDIKGWIPHWLVNIIQKKWPYRFIQAMDKRLTINQSQKAD